MKRSKLNEIIIDAIDFFETHQFALPPFAFWSPEVWRGKGAEASNIVTNGLGWDVTGYGMGDFKRYGLLLFTLRNGNVTDLKSGKGVPYAEKIMIAEAGQEHQMHFHWHKMEDIINRAGGDLVIQLYNVSEDNQLEGGEVYVMVNGVHTYVPEGEIVRLSPGESITLPTRTYHKFWAEGERVMMGEVSMVNDDRIDNCFYKPFGSGRFSTIEEDELPQHLLFTDYESYWQE